MSPEQPSYFLIASVLKAGCCFPASLRTFCRQNTAIVTVKLSLNMDKFEPLAVLSYALKNRKVNKILTYPLSKVVCKIVLFEIM